MISMNQVIKKNLQTLDPEIGCQSLNDIEGLSWKIKLDEDLVRRTDVSETMW